MRRFWPLSGNFHSEITVDGNKLTIYVKNPEKDNVVITDEVFRAGGHIQTVVTIGSTLEDAYLKLVKSD